MGRAGVDLLRSVVVVVVVVGRCGVIVFCLLSFAMPVSSCLHHCRLSYASTASLVLVLFTQPRWGIVLFFTMPLKPCQKFVM